MLKIGEIAKKYNITTRTLRFYEEMGLITSIRDNKFNRRLYDETSIIRLELILSLRKLSFSINEIKRIFNKDQNHDETLVENINQQLDHEENEISSFFIFRSIIDDFFNYAIKLNWEDEVEIKQLQNKVFNVKNFIQGFNKL